MPISLFTHNAEAYSAALEMLLETGKAAIVHPTGTGKSFIGFKLCEDYPDKLVCWISPSEYIFKTQLENLSAVSEGVWISRWLTEQVARLNKKPTGRAKSVKQLTEEQIEKLKALSMASKN